MTAPINTAADRVDVWNALLDEICEASPFTIVSKVMKAGSNISLVPDGLGGVTINATGSLSSIVVDGVTITGAGTVGSPYRANLSGASSVFSDGVTILGNGTAGNVLRAVIPSFSVPGAGQIGSYAIGILIGFGADAIATRQTWAGARNDNYWSTGGSGGGFVNYYGGTWVSVSAVQDFFVLVQRIA